MDSRSQTGRPEPESGEGDQWASSDLLVLKGLSSLDEAFSTDAADGSGLTVPVSEKAKPEESPAESGSGFRTAREMRAAQERQAAQERLAIRRKEGEALSPPAADASGGRLTAKPLIERSGTPFIAKTPPERLERPLSPPPKKASLTPSKETGWPMSSPPHPDSRPHSPVPPVSLEELAAKSPGVTPRPAPKAQPLVRTLKEPEGKRDPKGSLPPSVSSPSISSPKRAEIPPKREAQDSEKPLLRRGGPSTQTTPPPREEGIHSPPRTRPRPSESRVESATDHRRLVEPRLPEPKRQPVAGIVLTSVLLTSALWAVLIAAFWEFSAREWVDERFNVPSSATATAIDSTIESPQVMVREVAQLEAEVSVLDKQFNDWVRMNSLAQGAIANHDRDQFDDFTRQASLMAHAEMGSYLKSTEERIVKDYRGLSDTYAPLDVNGLFPSSDASTETDLDALELAHVMKNPDYTAPMRARAAFLIRNFGNDHQVQRTLLETVRTEKDLRIVMTAWDSLTQVTGYEFPNEFKVDRFLEWWDTRS